VRVLFDQGVPAPLAESKFDVLVTTDRNLRNQQNLAGRRIGIIVLPTTSWPRLQGVTSRIVEALNLIEPGQYRAVQL